MGVEAGKVFCFFIPNSKILLLGFFVTSLLLKKHGILEFSFYYRQHLISIGPHFSSFLELGLYQPWRTYMEKPHLAHGMAGMHAHPAFLYGPLDSTDEVSLLFCGQEQAGSSAMPAPHRGHRPGVWSQIPRTCYLETWKKWTFPGSPDY